MGVKRQWICRKYYIPRRGSVNGSLSCFLPAAIGQQVYQRPRLLLLGGGYINLIQGISREPMYGPEKNQKQNPIFF